jgi:hypothetical protein
VDGFALEAGEVPVLRCAALADLPGLAHGFSTRAFDLGPAEATAGVAARRRAFLRACGIAGESLVLRQVHGCAVVFAGEVPERAIPEADAAIWLSPRERAPAVRTADCVPILLADRRGRAAAAVHAGWRGTAAGIVGTTVRALAGKGIDPGELVAALGPAILDCCYEVGPDVLAEVASASGLPVPARGPGFLDLQACNRRQLEAAGVPASAIHALPWCTRCRSDLFFSFRREGEAAGRQMAVIGRRVALTPSTR